MRRHIARLRGTMKQHPTVRRIFGKQPLAPRARERSRTGRPAVPSGNVNPPAPGADQPPIVMLVALGLDGPAVSDLVDRVALAQTTTGFAPLFVVDHADFELLRRHGYLFEYIPAEGEWSERSGLEDWDEFAADRLRTVVREYGPDTMLSVPTDPDDPRGLTLETLISGLVDHPANE